MRPPFSQPLCPALIGIIGGRESSDDHPPPKLRHHPKSKRDSPKGTEFEKQLVEQVELGDALNQKIGQVEAKHATHQRVGPDAQNTVKKDMANLVELAKEGQRLRLTWCLTLKPYASSECCCYPLSAMASATTQLRVFFRNTVRYW